LLVGRLVVALGLLLCIKWFILASCSVFGGKKRQKFQGRERKLTELESFFFFTPYLWIAVFIAPLVFSFHDVFVLFSPI
jgi:hypothetical protein